MARTELGTSTAGGAVDDAASTFFRYDEKAKQPRARAVLVDMEEGVVHATLRDTHVGRLFEPGGVQVVSDVSGSGNNWAVGWHAYGTRHGAALAEAVRREAERCDSLQAFVVVLSTGGGTGSGFGTRAMALLDDAYPRTDLFAAVVLPSEDDDVVASPYNAELALAKLVEHADCVLPMANDALGDICDRIAEKADKADRRQSLSSRRSSSSSRPKQPPLPSRQQASRPFD
jgi:tubulin epsilon